MQTTLLGLAIAIILALVAALVGPLLIDWNNHRALFEAEASRLIGGNVRVRGPIEARLLPSPQLTLHDIAIGDGPETIRARKLGMEFVLGSLIRGEWRANELNLVGLQINLGLDPSGHVRAPGFAVAFKPNELSVDRLGIEDGTIRLTDAASGATVALEQVRFKGEARSLAGPLKGDGAVTVGGQRYPYRIALGRVSEEGASKLHLNVESADRRLSIEADGALALVGGAPRFDGALNLSRPVGIAVRDAGQSPQEVTQPWRVNGRLKATADAALMENIDLQYGSDEQGVKLTGVANFKFGSRPHVDVVLSGRQLDLDRAISGTEAAARQPPAVIIRELAKLWTGSFRTTLPFQVGIGIDQVTVGGNSVQNLRGDIASRADGWTLDRLEFRAPGNTQVRLSGHLNVRADVVAFAGPVEIDASDPKMLTAWLEGRSDVPQGELRPMNLRGEVAFGSDRIAVENLKAEFDRKPVTGRLAYFFPVDARPARLDAEIKAPQLDIDGAVAFGKALLAGSTMERPRDMSISADIERAIFAGVEARDARARIEIDASGLRLDRLSVGDFAGTSFAASGRVETGGHAPRGTLSLDLEAKQTAAAVATAGKFAPKNIEPAVGLLERVRRARLHATLDVTGDDKSAESAAQLAINGDLDDVRLDARMNVKGDWSKRSIADVRVDGMIDAAQGAALVKLMNLDWLATVGNGPGQLKVHLGGPPDKDMAFDGRLSADGLSVQASGSGQLVEGQNIKAKSTLRVLAADLRSLRSSAAAGSSLPLQMTSRVALANGTVTFEAIDAKLAGSAIRGRISVNDASPRRIDGAIDADGADISALLARAIGMQPQTAAKGAAWGWSSEPFGAGVLGRYSGTVALKFARATVLQQWTSRELKATLRLGEDELSLEDITGDLADGRLSGRIAVRRADDGLTARAKIALSGANATRFWSAGVRPPLTGSFDFSAEAEGTGLSPITLVGSLKGSGKIKLANAQVAGLDPRSFDAAMRAADQGAVIETGRISDLVGKSLDAGQLTLMRAEAVAQISAGQFRLSDASADAKDAGLSINGALDLTDGSIDARLTLSGLSEAAGARPNIFVALKGPVTAPARSIDVSALTGWLTLRAVENQTKRLRAIENVPPQPRGRGMPNTKQAPALPAPIDVRPLPTPRSAGQPGASVRSQY